MEDYLNKILFTSLISVWLTQGIFSFYSLIINIKTFTNVTFMNNTRYRNMKYFILLFFISTLSFVFGQNDDTDEQAVFWDGSSEICFPPIDYDFTDKNNLNEKINVDYGFLIQNHIPLTYIETRDPNILHPKRDKREVDIPYKTTLYYNVDFQKKIIKIFDCDKLVETYQVQFFELNKKELIIHASNTKNNISIYIENDVDSTFRSVRISLNGDDEETVVNKNVKILKVD